MRKNNKKWLNDHQINSLIYYSLNLWASAFFLTWDKIKSNLVPIFASQCRVCKTSNIYASGEYQCQSTYSYCQDHFTVEKVGRCPKCEEQKECSWKIWICAHFNEKEVVPFTCGHRIKECKDCRDNIDQCPVRVYGAGDGGTPKP